MEPNQAPGLVCAAAGVVGKNAELCEGQLCAFGAAPSGPLKAEQIIFAFPFSAKWEERSVVLIHLPFKCFLTRCLFAFINCFWVEYHENLSQKPAIFSTKNFSDVIAEKL